MENMEIWNKVKTPPPEAIKKITGGRLSGKSDINPQWRYDIMTEVFGPCGIGWKYEILEHWIEEGSEGIRVVFVKIHLFINLHTDDATSIETINYWSNAIPGVGGKDFVAKESAGLRTSDEALKMAVTDALGTAMKMLGVAADVYRGTYDGSKNVDNTTVGDVKPEPKTKVQHIKPENIGGGEMKATVFIGSIEEKGGFKKDGSPWTLYKIVDTDQVSYSTFSETDGDIANDCAKDGMECVIAYTKSPDGKYNNLTSIKAIDADEGKADDALEELIDKQAEGDK